MSMTKGHKPVNCSYAKGGAVIGQTSQFMKTPDNFRSPDQKVKNYGKAADKAVPPKRKGGK